ncbi:hypothetical protein AB4Z48_13950 [Cupriavidus sp. 2TAF22]|uniref:hypothetical protein n=1 Tax=unclassified Cupriavidus TaxID=2640874 RepID=UPI003F90CEBB
MNAKSSVQREDHDMRRSPARLLPVLDELRRQVRERSRLARKLTLKRAGDGTEDHGRRLADLFDGWIERGDPRTKVICFASATEFGMAMQHHAERCRAAAQDEGSEALRALFWAALRRIQARRGYVPEMGARAPVPAPASSAAGPVADRAADRAADTTGDTAAAPSLQDLCQRCESLRHDVMCADGHASLRPLGEVRWRSFGAGVVCQTREHQCRACLARWTRRWSVSDPFTGWTMTGGVAPATHDRSLGGKAGG